jgi:hypothetical protein
MAGCEASTFDFTIARRCSGTRCVWQNVVARWVGMAHVLNHPECLVQAKADVRLDNTLASQPALQPVEGREDETRKLGVLSKQKARDGHHLAAGVGAHAGHHQ